MKLKKPGEADEHQEKNKSKSAVTLDDVILAALERGLTMTDIRRMQVGRVVDFVIAYNERVADAKRREKQKETQRRKATQNDINAFFG